MQVAMAQDEKGKNKKATKQEAITAWESIPGRNSSRGPAFVIAHNPKSHNAFLPHPY
jgi:hypothetical protein